MAMKRDDLKNAVMKVVKDKGLKSTKAGEEVVITKPGAKKQVKIHMPGSVQLENTKIVVAEGKKVVASTAALEELDQAMGLFEMFVANHLG